MTGSNVLIINTLYYVLKYTIINTHAPVNQENKQDKKVNKYWYELDKIMRKIPKSHKEEGP